MTLGIILQFDFMSARSIFIRRPIINNRHYAQTNLSKSAPARLVCPSLDFCADLFAFLDAMQLFLRGHRTDLLVWQYARLEFIAGKSGRQRALQNPTGMHNFGVVHRFYANSPLVLQFYVPLDKLLSVIGRKTKICWVCFGLFASARSGAKQVDIAFSVTILNGVFSM